VLSPRRGARRTTAGWSLRHERDRRAADRGVVAFDGKHSCDTAGGGDRLAAKAIVDSTAALTIPWATLQSRRSPAPVGWRFVGIPHLRRPTRGIGASLCRRYRGHVTLRRQMAASRTNPVRPGPCRRAAGSAQLAVSGASRFGSPAADLPTQWGGPARPCSGGAALETVLLGRMPDWRARRRQTGRRRWLHAIAGGCRQIAGREKQRRGARPELIPSAV